MGSTGSEANFSEKVEEVEPSKPPAALPSW